MRFRSSFGRQRSGTGSQMKMGFSAWWLRDLRARRMVVTRLMQRVGEQIRWKDLESRRARGREVASRRSFGVTYLKERFSFSSKEFQPRVVSRDGS